MSGLFEKGESSSTATNTVNIPEFLRPLIGQATSITGSTLARLREMAQFGDDRVAGFTPDQRAAFEQVREFSGNVPGLGILDAAAGGEGLSFLPPGVGDALSGFGGLDFLPPAARAALTQGASTSALPQEQINQLRQTAGGDFLMGGEGFDSAVQAAVRAAQPAILSTFGGAGVGGGTGALSQAAIGTAATDAFARQFAQERQNQMGAQDTLARLGLADRGQQLQSAGLLGDFAAGAEGRALEGSGLLAGLSDAERARQLQSAQMLPGLSLAGIQPLLDIGGMQQQNRQQQLSAPFDMQMQLLGAILGIPGSFSPLFGGTQTGESDFSGFRLGFGDQ